MLLELHLISVFFFFFSSRRRHTRLQGDWSSDVCSSDLTADATVADTSDATFKITGSLTLTAPNGGEKWGVNTLQNITWTKTGSIASVRLDYSANGTFSDAVVIVASTPAAAGSYAWTIPDALSTTVKVRVTDVSDSTVADASDAAFTILAGFTLSAPNGGEVWTVGDSRTITWTTTGTIPNIKLEYSKDNFTTTVLITASAPNTGTFAWTVPDDLSATVRVRVTNVNDSTVFDDSDANFKIQGALTVTSPNGGETWTVGATQAITWATSGTVANVKLEFSKDNFATATVITASTPNTGTYSWIIPDAISATVKVRVSNAVDAEANDVSDANFKIRGGLVLVAPNGGETWTVGATQAISWTTSGTGPHVKLQYSTDGGGD